MNKITPSTKLKIVSVSKLKSVTCLRKYYWRRILNLESRNMNLAFWYGGVLAAVGKLNLNHASVRLPFHLHAFDAVTKGAASSFPRGTVKYKQAGAVTVLIYGGDAVCPA